MSQVANEVKDEKGFLVVKDYDAPRALVYKVWTDPALVARWWGIEGATNPVCELDVRVGGEWRIDMRVPNGMVFPNRGIYEEVVPGKRLVFSDLPIAESPAWNGNPPGPMRHVVEFSDLPGGGTRVALSITMNDAADCRRLLGYGVRGGIEQSLSRAGRLIEALKVDGAAR